MNAFDPIDPKLIDVVLPFETGYSARLQAEDTTDVLRDVCGAATRDFPEDLWIEPEDWADKASDNDKYKTWALNYTDRFTNQNPTHECTCHSLRANAEAARNRQRGIIYPDGPKDGFRYAESSKGAVWLSPMSVYAEANPGQWGGANVRQVLEIACRRGFLPDKIQPHDYKFKHAITGTAGKGNNNQSGGEWVSVKEFPSGWEDTARWFKPLEVVFPETWEQAMCLLLHGISVSVGRSGHAIPEMMPVFEGKNVKNVAYPDSYNVIRYDSLSTFKSCAANGSFAIVTMTAPDDWMNPAGA